MRNYKKSSRKGFELEEYIASKLKPIDKHAKPTRNSGASNGIADVENSIFYVECKQKKTKQNINIDYEKEWKKLINDMPINSDKTPIIATENKTGDRFVTLKAEDFFEMLYLIYLTDE